MRYPWIVSAALIWLGLMHSSAFADVREDAEKYFRSGLSLQKLEDFEAAISQYKASLRLLPTKSALFNLANCLRTIHRYPEAHAALERLLDEHAGDLDPAMAAATRSQLEELSRLTSTLDVAVVDNDVSVSGAELRVDGVFLAKTPLTAPLRLKVGRRKLQITAPGFEPATVFLDLAPGSSVAHVVRLTRADPPSAIARSEKQPWPDVSPIAAPASREERTSTSTGTIGWVSIGAGTVLLGGGVFTGLWALSVDRDLDKRCDSGLCPATAKSSLQRRDALAFSTNILFGVGAASVVGGILLISLQPDPASVRAKAHFGPGFLGAELSREF